MYVVEFFDITQIEVCHNSTIIGNNDVILKLQTGLSVTTVQF